MNYSLHDPNAYISRQSKHEITFQQPMQQRVLGNLLIIVFIAMIVIPIYKSYLSIAIDDFWLIVPGFVVLLGPVVVLLFYLNAPYQLYLDLNQRTYKLRRGYKLFESTFSGPFSDIDFLEIQSKYSREAGQRTYIIALIWKQYSLKRKMKPIVLGNTYIRQEAEALLREYANDMNVRLVNNL